MAQASWADMTWEILSFSLTSVLTKFDEYCRMYWKVFCQIMSVPSHIHDWPTKGRSPTFESKKWNYCGGVLEQLACYTMRYQESDLHLGLYSSLTSANNLNLPTLLTLFYSTYFYCPRSSIVADFTAKAGHTWVSGPGDLQYWISYR